MSSRRTTDKKNILSGYINSTSGGRILIPFNSGLTVTGDTTLFHHCEPVNITQNDNNKRTITGSTYHELVIDPQVFDEVYTKGELLLTGTMTIYNTGADGDDGLLIVGTDAGSADDRLGGIGFDSHDGNIPSSILEASSYISGYASEAHAAGDKGGNLTFGATAKDDDDDTTSHERIRINSEGVVTFGTGGVGLHIISTEITCSAVRSVNNTVIAEVPNIKIPAKSIVDKVAVIIKQTSDLDVSDWTHDVNIQLSATTGTAADATIVSGTEILGQGVGTTQSSNTAASTDISLGYAPDLKEVWFSYGGRTFLGDDDVYIYVCNAGNLNGAGTGTGGVESGDPTTPGIIQIIIEYYGMD